MEKQELDHVAHELAVEAQKSKRSALRLKSAASICTRFAIDVVPSMEMRPQLLSGVRYEATHDRLENMKWVLKSRLSFLTALWEVLV